MTAEGLAAFSERVVGDAGLRHDLLGAEGRQQFVNLVVQLAEAAGLEVEPCDVEEGLRARRRAWQERWI